MKPANLNKHDLYLVNLCSKLRPDYDVLLTHVVLKGTKRPVGEIDIYARKGDRIDLYEVKCSYRIVKAKKQLKKVDKYLGLENVNHYFYCGNSDLLIKLEKDK